eukprot:TRINITY_DN5887_c0_g1_i1.p1 TRINITY_DN5887_c0_g1~~TRINITY_DN5887_c0_g1_i1.p1  ORF type:complete len:226 (-),score=57.85 TRINITY_DN5887_c0_g1_i1:927-1604(-)
MVITEDMKADIAMMERESIAVPTAYEPELNSSFANASKMVHPSKKYASSSLDRQSVYSFNFPFVDDGLCSLLRRMGFEYHPQRFRQGVWEQWMHPAIILMACCFTFTGWVVFTINSLSKAPNPLVPGWLEIHETPQQGTIARAVLGLLLCMVNISSVIFNLWFFRQKEFTKELAQSICWCDVLVKRFICSGETVIKVIRFLPGVVVLVTVFLYVVMMDERIVMRI